jgi:hypothetical protein
MDSRTILVEWWNIDCRIANREQQADDSRLLTLRKRVNAPKPSRRAGDVARHYGAGLQNHWQGTTRNPQFHNHQIAGDSVFRSESLFFEVNGSEH